MTPLDKIITVAALFTLGWVANDMADMAARKQTQREEVQHVIAVDCDAAFANLTAEQVYAIETCNTDNECYALAVANGIPKECAE